MKIYINSILTLVFILSTSFAQGQKLKDVKPIVKKQAVKILTGKKKTYYALDSKKSVDYNVSGIEKVVIYSRKRIKNNKLTTYAIIYQFDQQGGTSYRASKTKTDKKSAYMDKSLERKVAHFYKKEVVIPLNTTNLSLFLEKTKGVDAKVIGYKAGQKITLKPTQYDKKTNIRSGEVFKYYKLNSKIKTTIKLDKPGKLIVYTRMRLNDKGMGDYFFSYKIDKANFTKVNVTATKPASKTMYKSFYNTKTPSAFYKTIINIDDAAQQVEFTSKDAVDARFVLIEAPEKITWTAVKTDNTDPVILTTKKTNKDRIYNRINTTKTFNFNIDAKKATKIKLFVRGEFTYDMLSNNDYELLLRDNGKIINTYKLSCDRSREMKYKDNDELIPGTLDKVFINVSKGKHNYSIAVNNNGKTALIRVLVQE